MPKKVVHEPWNTPINLIAYIITLAGVSFIGYISWYIIGVAHLEGAKLVLTSILPVLAGWVGTILAYFYSKQSLDSANQRVADLTSHLTSADKLKTIPVKDQMISRDNMFRMGTADYGLKLPEVLKKVQTEKKGQRVPILAANDRPLYVIHRSVLDRYLAEQLQATPHVDANTLTLGKFIADKEAEIKFSVALVPADATLDQAKVAMNAMSQNGWCQDVFVTKTGNKDEEVLGWVTNRIIEDNSKV